MSSLRPLAVATALAVAAVALSAAPAMATATAYNGTNGTNSTNGTDPYGGGGGYAKDPMYHFNLIFHTLIFVVALWLAGKLVVRLGAPALVGEILIGILLGPNLLNFVPKASSLQLYGEMGLILLIVEAGIHVSRRSMGCAGC